MRKFISLLSPGLDSPVAAYLMLKKKFHPVFLSFLTFNNQNIEVKQGIIQIVKILSRYTKGKLRVYFINHSLNLNTIKLNCERKLTCILCKRLMIQIAMQIARLEKTNIIITGDILGEQASQTLDNLYSYNNITNGNIIVRPLIGWNKLDVIDLNKRMGLYDLVSKLSTSCRYNPQYPETHGKVKEIQINESKIDISATIKESIKSAELFEF